MARSRRSARRSPAPRYPGLELASAMLNVAGCISMLAGAALVVLGVIRIANDLPAEGVTIAVSGGSILSIGVIQLGLAGGLIALRDISQNSHMMARSR